LVDLRLFESENHIDFSLPVPGRRHGCRAKILMLGTLISFFSLAVAFGALWYAGEANKRAEFQHKKFYDSHVRGISDTVKVMVKTVKDISSAIHRLNKEVNDLSEDDETVELFKKVSDLESTVTKLLEKIDGPGHLASDKRPARRRML
jgi:hypothetical protein